MAGAPPPCLSVYLHGSQTHDHPLPPTFFLELTSLSSQHREGEMGMDMGKS